MHLIQAVIQHDSDIEKEDQQRTNKISTHEDTLGTKTMTDNNTPNQANSANGTVTTPPESDNYTTNGSVTQSEKVEENPQDMKQQEPEQAPVLPVEDESPVVENTPKPSNVGDNGESNEEPVVETPVVAEDDKGEEVEKEPQEVSKNNEIKEVIADANVEKQNKKTREELEAKAIAEATASANANYTPPTSLLNSSSPYPLIRSVDGMSLKKYNPTPSIFTARGVPVPLRGKLNVPVHVTLGGSIVEYTIESKEFDIGIGIVAQRDEGETVVTSLERADAHLKPVSGKFLVGTVPCALIFTFDNEYSWFREKRITYQITIRPPTKENIISGRKVRAKSALKLVSKDRIGAEERLGNVSSFHKDLASDVERLEKELEEKKKSLGVAEKEVGWLKKRVQLRSVQEDLLHRRLADGWEDENELDDEDDEEDGTPDRAEI